MRGYEMSKIRKPCGNEEEFDRTRLERSIRSAGARPETADRIARSIHVTEGLSSEIVRNAVAEELRKEDPMLSKTYMATENLVTKREPKMPQGVAHVSADVLRYLRVPPGQQAVLAHAGRVADVRVEGAKTVHPKEIALSGADLNRLAADEGARVSVRFPR